MQVFGGYLGSIAHMEGGRAFQRQRCRSVDKYTFTLWYNCGGWVGMSAAVQS